ncbi:unnamed protein product [Fraxinus pennsylvanica]|uniref:Uncharacterized protein n=1 Tax=Fraxinus pennsylvanica TaxID=56036 RepID=A0AAD2EG69_9LAMI|nr:unnamed protein product [Fraxinus pennsylvanica]
MQLLVPSCRGISTFFGIVPTSHPRLSESCLSFRRRMVVEDLFLLHLEVAPDKSAISIDLDSSVAEKDDWVPRKVTPHRWYNQDYVGSSSTKQEVPSSHSMDDKSKNASYATESQSMD